MSIVLLPFTRWGQRFHGGRKYPQVHESVLRDASRLSSGQMQRKLSFFTISFSFSDDLLVSALLPIARVEQGGTEDGEGNDEEFSELKSDSSSHFDNLLSFSGVCFFPSVYKVT